jgi:hypothetical protein
MKKTTILALSFLAATIFLAHTAWSEPQTFNGVVSDSMCVKKHMMPGKSDAQCIQECVKAGSKYVLVAGAKVYPLNAKAALIAPFAGKQVQVQGELKNSTLTVQAIHNSSK